MSAFRTILDPDSWLDITIEGKPHTVPAGISVAAALLISGYDDCRVTPVSGIPRAPYCMMGVCFDCLVEINGRPNQQACMTSVQEDMRVRRQDGRIKTDRLPSAP